MDVLISKVGLAYNNIPVWHYADISKNWAERGGGKAFSLAEFDQLFAAIYGYSPAAHLEILIPPEKTETLLEDVYETMHQKQIPKLKKYFLTTAVLFRG